MSYVLWCIGPSASPQNLQVNVVNSTFASVSWIPPSIDQQNGIITHYTVILYNDETGYTLSFNTTEVFLQLNNLHAFYNYECSVAAVTVSTGPTTSVLFETPENGNAISAI